MRSLCLTVLFCVFTLPAWAQVIALDEFELCEGGYFQFRAQPGGCNQGWSFTLDEDNIYGIRFDRSLPWIPVLFTRSTDGGKTFEDPRVITSVGGGEHLGWQLLTEAGVIHFAFTKTPVDIVYCRSEDQGDSFQCQNWSLLGMGFRVVGEFWLVASGPYVYVAFIGSTQETGLNFRIRASRDAGKTFGPILTPVEDPDHPCPGGFTASGNTITLTVRCGSNPQRIFRGRVVEE